MESLLLALGSPIRLSKVTDASSMVILEDLLLQEDLIQVMPMINEANAMSEEMDRKMVYDIALVTAQARGEKDGKTEVQIGLIFLFFDNVTLF